MLDHTEILNEIETRSRLEKFFSLSADKPTILLVFDENHTRDVLKSVGIDTSKWQSGLSNLLYRREEKFESRRNYGLPLGRRPRLGGDDGRDFPFQPFCLSCKPSVTSFLWRRGSLCEWQLRGSCYRTRTLNRTTDCIK